MRVDEIAEFLGLPFEGNGAAEITSGAAVESAGEADLAFVESAAAAGAANESGAGCLIVPADFADGAGRTLIRSKEPRTAFARVIRELRPPEKPPLGIHPTAVIFPDAVIGDDVSIGPHAVIEPHARLGDNVVVGPGCWIGRGVAVGNDSTLHAGVSLYPGTRIGMRALIHAGAVIGADGFGFTRENGRYEKFPQLGRVRIGDDCEIGAGSAIDRAALGETVLGDGVKLDNLVHIGHNCRIGSHVVIAALAGLSGGCVVEDHAVLGGQFGAGEKAVVGAGAQLGGRAGVLSNQKVEGGRAYWGTPARPYREHLKKLAYADRLPDLFAEVKRLRARIEELEADR